MGITIDNALTASANAITVGGGVYYQDIRDIVQTINYANYHFRKTHLTLNFWKDSLYGSPGQATTNYARISSSVWQTIARADIYVDRYSAIQGAVLYAETLNSSSNTVALSITASGPLGSSSFATAAASSFNNSAEWSHSFTWDGVVLDSGVPTSSWVSIIINARKVAGGSTAEIGSIRIVDKEIGAGVTGSSYTPYWTT